MAQQLEKARALLLDLSLRNRLLNFRPTRRSTIMLEGEQAQALFRLLLVEGKRLAFLPAGGPGPQTADPTDLNLSCALDAENLQKNLLHLERSARSFLEEKGINALYLALGFVRWRREDKPDRELTAPLLLLPVCLERLSAARRFRLKALEDGAVVNPCLRALLESNYGLVAPDLDEQAEPEEQDVDALFARWRETLGGQPSWRVDEGACLGLFSFAKVIMHADLDPERWAEADRDLLAHALLRSMAAGEAPPSGPPGTPPEPDAPDRIAPEDCYQVMEADSSQQRAILSAKRGLSFVLEGPPGTGKSQTIANTIAECLASGKRVLFVSQKLAALEVVKRRLDLVGLGDFCLELHSTKASRKALVNELARGLARGRLETDGAENLARELRELRASLADYARELHAPIEPFGKSPQQAIGRMARLHRCPDIFCELPDFRSWSEDVFRELKEQVAQLGRALEQVAPLEDNPWRGCAVDELSGAEKAELFEDLTHAAARLQEARETGAILAATLGCEPAEHLGRLEELHRAGEHLAVSAGVEERLIMSDCWNEYPAARRELIESLAELSELRVWAKSRYAARQLAGQDWQGILKRRLSRQHNPFRVFLPSHWRDKRLFRDARLAEHQPAGKEAVEDLRRLAAFKARLAELQQGDELGREVFGLTWRGPASDPTSLGHLADWLHQTRRFWLAGRLGAAGLQLALSGADRRPLREQASRLGKDLLAFEQAWAAAQKRLRLDQDGDGIFDPAEDQAVTESIEHLLGRLAGMRARPESLIAWTRYQALRNRALQSPIARFVDKAEQRLLHPSLFAAAFEKQTLRLQIEAILAERPTLGAFDGRDHQAARERFAKVDPAWLRHNHLRLHARLSQARPLTQFGAAGSSQLGILQGEVTRKRGGRSIRRLFADAADVVGRLKPCLMMSPLSVAQYLAPGAMDFDLVIFDEASQVEPADALGAIARARQLVLVGDTRQLPPTAFFAQVNNQEPDPEEHGAAGLQDMESILDRGAQVLPRLDLLWHYRSRHDALINFANRSFYDSRLLVFPAAQRQAEQLGLQMEYHPEDLYERGGSGSNPAQARRLADWIFAQLKAHPDKSLGVGAFSQAQQQAILDALEDRRREDDSQEELFHPDRPDPFFVKNLETIQGDERDVIALSIGYGKTASDEPLGMNFGPLNQDGGWRRLNVLITRARERCVIFSSIRPEDFRLERTEARGVHALCDYLRYAFAQGAEGAVDAQVSEPGDLEQVLAEALTEDGLQIRPRLGGGPFALDLALLEPERSDRYLLGLALDGASYREAWTVRDRERAFDAVLERLGWRLHHLWSPDWYRSPKLCLEGVQRAITAARAKPAPAEDRLPTSGPEADSPASGLRKATPGAGDFGFELYQRFKPERERTSAQFYKLPPGRLADVLLEIVLVEGPIHEELAIGRLAECWSLGRMGSKVRSAGRKAIDHAVRAGAVARRGDFLWPKGMTVPKVRRREDEDLRDATYICPQELGQAAVSLLQMQFGMSREDLLQQTARALGYSLTGRKIRAAVDLAVQQEIDRGRIQVGEDDILQPPDDKTPPPRPPPRSNIPATRRDAAVDAQCPDCLEPIKAGVKFCPHCGLRLERPTCPACKAQVKINAKFCGHCGQSLQ